MVLVSTSIPICLPFTIVLIHKGGVALNALLGRFGHLEDI